MTTKHFKAVMNKINPTTSAYECSFTGIRLPTCCVVVVGVCSDDVCVSV